MIVNKGRFNGLIQLNIHLCKNTITKTLTGETLITGMCL